MAEFTNQTTLREQIISALSPLIPAIEEWRPVWPRISDQKKIDFLCEGKSMFLSAAAGVYIYLRPFFKSLDDEIDSGEIQLNLDNFTLRRPE